MSFISKTTTVRSSIIRDKPTPRAPIRRGYPIWKVAKKDDLILSHTVRNTESIQASGIDHPSWKVAKKDAPIPSHTVRNIESIQASGIDRSTILKKSSNTYSTIQCSVKRKDAFIPGLMVRNIESMQASGVDHPTWKVAKKDALIPSHTVRNTESIQASGSDRSTILKKSSNIYSTIHCPVKRKDALIPSHTVRNTESIQASGIDHPTWKVAKKDALIPSHTVRNTESIQASGIDQSTILKKSSNIYSTIPCSVKTSTYSSVTTVKTVANNLNRDENKIAVSEPTNQKSLQNNDLVTSRPAIRDSQLVTNASSTINKMITSSQEISNKKSVSLVGEAFFPDFFPNITHKSILDEINILKTPVNDSLTRKTILTNVVPVTSLIAKTLHYKEHIASDVPTARDALRSDRDFFNTALYNLDDSISPSQVEDSQAINSPIEKNVLDICSYKIRKKSSINSHINQNPIIDPHTSLTTRDETMLSTLTSEDICSTNKEDTNLTIQSDGEDSGTLSRQDSEPFVIPVEDLELSQLSEENEKQARTIIPSDELNVHSNSILTDIDLTIGDRSVNLSGSKVSNKGRITTLTTIQTSNKSENTLSNMKITVDKDNEESEIISPSSDIIINLPPLISPMNSANTKTSDYIKVMIPDSTTDPIPITTRIRKPSKKINREPSLRIKMKGRHAAVKRKIIEDSTSKAHSDLDKTKKIKIDKAVPRKPRKVKTTKAKRETKKSEKQKSAKLQHTNESGNKYVIHEPSTPRTRNLMINPRTKRKRDPLILTI